jgi:polysaccharide biosynthesis transport protein
MPQSQPPTETSLRNVPVPYTPPGPPPRGYEERLNAPPPASGSPWARYISAIRRYKWLIGAVAILGSAGGILATRFVAPTYRVNATIWISTDGPGQQERGPIRADELLSSSSWIELFKSGVVIDPVVSELRLYVIPDHPADVEIFQRFSPGRAFRPGNYQITIEDSGTRYSLADSEGNVIEQGAVGDSIGRPVGFAWAPTAALLGSRHSIEFAVITPREASLGLLENLSATIPRTGDGQSSNFLRLSLVGTDSDLTARILNRWVEEFLRTAERLKKRNLVEFAKILRGQLDYAQVQLKEAEIELESFKVNTITQPSEGTPVSAGVEEFRDPVFQSFFDQKVQHEEVKRDREALERIIADSRDGQIMPEAFYSIPNVVAGAQGLRSALDELSSKEAQLRVAQQVWTDEHNTVKELRHSVNTLRQETVPSMTAALLEQLRRREAELGRRIESASRELRSIPTRTIEEMRLRREVDVSVALYSSLQTRYEEARLAEASAVADVQPLDAAVAPQRPEGDRTTQFILMAVMASIGAGLALAILLDRLDGRVRYPDQITHELGLDILGAVPTIKEVKNRSAEIEKASAVVEAFRTIRLALTHAAEPHSPFMVTVTSPCPGDGKSLVSANLALSFAEAGYRTLLIDGDIRRGHLHSAFGGQRRPGLVDCLLGSGEPTDVMQSSSHENLTLLSCGARRQRGPELLASQAMESLMRAVEPKFDAIIVDSSPLGAGIDPLALGIVTRNMILVLKNGQTDRKLAQAKLEMVDRLPVRMLGAVLNDFHGESIYKYYTYDDSYALEAEDPTLIGARQDA